MNDTARSDPPPLQPGLTRMSLTDPPAFLRTLFDRVLEVADPMRALTRFPPHRPLGGVMVVVVGAGKVSARMAEVVEAIWGLCAGLVIARCDHARPCRGGKAMEAVQPVPGAAEAAPTRRILDRLAGVGEDDLELALISGGAYVLLCASAAGLVLAEKQAVNAVLLASATPIPAINTVRRHLSRVKGGQRAAAAFPARVLALMISDVSDPEGRARVRALPCMIACDIHPLNNLRVLNRLVEQFGADEAAQQLWFVHWVETTFDPLELMLACDDRTGLYCHGDRHGLADCCLHAQIWNNRHFGIDTVRWPMIARIFDALDALPPFRDAAPMRQPDAA
jgi:hypothetical protein